MTRDSEIPRWQVRVGLAAALLLSVAPVLAIAPSFGYLFKTPQGWAALLATIAGPLVSYLLPAPLRRKVFDAVAAGDRQRARLKEPEKGNS